ncbi:MAG: sulfatase-like hydrolase/transferase [FCB group bacterium]|jgi:arylsulfatase A-like enzyme|nr:sulfatase-like hydrolase/transferase [FCB group bacterium]
MVTAKKAISFALKLGVTVALFTLLFRPETFGLRPDLFGNVSPRTMLAELRAAQPHELAFWLTFAAVIKLCGMFAGMIRWNLLLKGQGLHIPFRRLAQSWFIGRYIGIFLPGTIGLDGYRLIDSARYTGEIIKSTTVIAVEKLIGFISLTFLVFLTFPLGFRLLKLNVAVLAVILLILAAFVAVSFLLLLNPRVIQVLVAVLPTPRALRDKLDRLGVAVTAYSGNRTLLLKATFCGLLVHLATCFMFFGTMMSIRATGTTILDILFASPIMIYGTVLGPSVGGEGIREIVFVTLLKGTTPATTAALFSHLGWWVGEFVPAVIGATVLVLSARPSRAEIEEGISRVRAAMGNAPLGLHLSPEAASEYRARLVNTLTAGIAAGLIGGAAVGLAEAVWVSRSLVNAEELRLFWWAPAAYGLMFTLLGFGLAAVAAFYYLLRDRFASTANTFAGVLGLVLAMALFVIGSFRVQRDLLDMHRLGALELAAVAATALGVGFIAALLSARLLRRSSGSFLRAAALALGVFAMFIVAGGVAGAVAKTNARPVPLAELKAKPAGPNIILVAVDTLRADYLPMYAQGLPIETPALQAFAQDGVVFERCFAQASWTKPAFGSIFTGLYPESHTATGKDSALPGTVTTFAEALQKNGYYTKGFANNPNITASLHFDQGFASYVDLRTNLYFGASPSASNLSLYRILRVVRVRVMDRLGRLPVVGKRMAGMDVRDFYQPGERVNEEVFRWLDSPQAPKDRPFLLFVHYMDPHDPYFDRDSGKAYARAQNAHPDADKMLEPMVKAYYDEIEYTDFSFGLLLEGLKRRGLYDNNVILFTADHGEEFHDHQGWWHGDTLYDEQIHVPLLMKLPAGTEAGNTAPDLVRHIDIAPTLLRLAGLEPAPEMQGKPLFTPQGGLAVANTEYVYSQVDFEGNILEAVRTPETKLIRANPGNPRGLAPVEYYDLAQDPKETQNVTGKGDIREASLGEVMTGMKDVVEANAAEPVIQQELSQDLKDQLGAIGYTQ